MSRSGGQSLLKFKYNADGIRTSKTVNGVEHVYTLHGSQIVSEAWGDYLLIYLYDESGSPIGMQYRTSSYAADVFDTFYFEKNLQGDIIAIYTESGRKILEYTYDAWGNHSVTWTYLTMETLPAGTNPFRYRGYYYDTDTGLYYLQSRYYNPAWGRFLNADGYVNANGDLIGFNMYTYCSNNPVMYADPTGESIVLTALILGAVIGAAIGGTLGGTIAYNAAKSEGLEGSDLLEATLQGVGKGALIGGVAGGLIGASGGAAFVYGLTSVAGSTMITSTSTLVLGAFEVGTLQFRKSLADGKNGWQAANDSMDSIIHNTPKIAGSMYTKLGTATSSYAAATHANANYVRGPFPALSWNSYISSKSVIGAGFSYAMLVLPVINTISAFTCNNPMTRAYERGYDLK